MRAVGAIRGTTSMADMKDADFIIEAATENADLKKKILTDDAVPPDAIIANEYSRSTSLAWPL